MLRLYLQMLHKFDMFITNAQKQFCQGFSKEYDKP